MRLGIRSGGLIAAVVLVSAACGGNMALEETGWSATSLNGDAMVPGTSPTVVFVDDTTVAGFTGCNNYQGTYEVDRNTIRFDIGPMTLIACNEPVTAQESEFLGILAGAATFEQLDDELRLFDAEDNETVRFEAISQELAGTSWQAINYNTGTEAVTTLIIGTEATLVFDEEGGVSGRASCNNFFGDYEADSGDLTISFGLLGATEMFCAEPPGVMDQEAAYLAALQNATMYRTTDPNTLELRDDDGALQASFTRS